MYRACLAAALIACHGHSAAIDGDAPIDVAADATVDAAPMATAPQLLLDGTALYPRAIRIASGAILVSVVTPPRGTILKSVDDGVTFAVLGHIQDPVFASGLCCASIFERPDHTLVWAASVGGDTPNAPMQIIAWQSSDGAAWTRLATIATGGVTRAHGGLWEPEFEVAADGALVCHYSDETDPAHSQKLARVRSTDGVHWSAPAPTVALATFGARPGMANVRRLANGTYAMSYEVCGTDGCTAHLRTSTDGWDWGDPADAGLRPITVDGMHFAHAPTLAWNPTPGNGRLYLVGQMVYDGAGNVAPENGHIVLANTEGGNQRWFELAAPVPIAAPYDNFCPNYSSPLLPLDGGAFALEVATQWDGNVCRAYAARGPLAGSGDTQGLHDNARYRLVNTMSALCLDVSGGSSAPGTQIQQWTCNDMAPQNWTLVPTAGGHALRAENSGLCLAIAGASTPGARVVQSPCDGSAAQAWSVRNAGLATYTLVHDQLCLDDSGGSTQAGSPIQLWSCNDLAPQLWHAEPH